MNRLLHRGACIVMAVGLAACDGTDKTPKPSVGMAGGAVAPAPTSAPPLAPGAGAPAMPVAGAERVFMAEAALRSLAQIEASRFVAGRTADPALKAFALQLEREHASANDELKRIAREKGIVVPVDLEGDPKARLDQLKSLPPAEVERAFVQQFGVDAHAKTIQLFENQLRDGGDPSLRSFAEQTLPRLREHLAMAQQLQGKRPGT